MNIAVEQSCYKLGQDGIIHYCKEESSGPILEEIDDNKVAHCDLCYAVLGAYKDVKAENIIQPETFASAVRNGLRPKAAMAGLPQEIADSLIVMWLETVQEGETEWALCDKCNEEVQEYMER